jgi:hypothetical protein
MTYVLTEEQSIECLEGSWDALAIEDYVAQDLALQGVEVYVAVLLSDGTVAFYMDCGVVL